MNAVIIACRGLESELEDALKNSNNKFEVLYFDSGLHINIEKLRAEVEMLLNYAYTKGYDTALFAMGSCGNAYNGITTPIKIIVPKVDDCITLLLHTNDKSCVNLKNAGCMYMTKGMVELIDVTGGDFGMTYEASVEKFGEDSAKEIRRMMYEHYTHFAMIDTGVYNMKEIEVRAKFYADLVDCDLITIKGSNIILENLVNGKFNYQYLEYDAGSVVDTSRFLD